MRKENFNLLFANRSRLLKSGEAAIFMRITANGTRVECNTGKSIEPHLWNQAKERAKGNSKKAVDLNNYIDDMEIGMFKMMQEMQQEGVAVTVRELTDFSTRRDINLFTDVVAIWATTWILKIVGISKFVRFQYYAYMFPYSPNQGSHHYQPAKKLPLWIDDLRYVYIQSYIFL